MSIDSPAINSNGPSLTPAKRGSVVTVLLVIFIDLLGFGIVIPLLPFVTAGYGALPEWAMTLFGWMGIEGENRTNAVAIGILSLAFNLTQFVFAPVWGRLSDHVGRKPVLAMSMLGYTASWAMFVWSPSLTWLIASRTLAGIFAANISTAQAYIADVFPPEKRSKGMGLVGAAFGLGFTLGPAIGSGLSVLGEWLDGVPDTGMEARTGLGLHLPIYFAMGLSFVAFLLAAFKLPESLTPELRAVARARQRVGRIKLLKQALGQPLLGSLLIGFFTVTFGFAILEQLYSEFTRVPPLSMAKWETGIAFTVIGLTIVVMQGGLIGRLTKKYGPWRLVFFGVLLEGVTLLFFGMVGGMGVLLLASVALAAGNSLCNPSILALISRNTPSDQQGGSMGLSAASSAMGRVLGPVLGGLIWGLYGPVVTFACGGAVVLMALPFLIRARRIGGPGVADGAAHG